MSYKVNLGIDVSDINRRLTWTNAVKMITPVPNCFRMVKMLPFISVRERRTKRMGANTAITE